MKLRREDYDVRPTTRAVAADIVARFHYAGGGPNTGVHFHGLYRVDVPDVCLGVAWWLPPTKLAAIASAPAGYDWRRVLALSRLAIDPDVPTNGASFLLGASERLIRRERRWGVLVTYADTWRGHTGAIYRAANWEYLGETSKEAVWVDAEGRMVARKRGPRTLTNAEMTARDYVCLGRFAKHKFRKVLPMPKPSNADLADRLRAAWSADTSADPGGWTTTNPAYGQCAVSALIVQDVLGGELRRGVVAGVSHYWNVLPDGRTLDLTFDQFPAGTRPTEADEPRSRDYVLSFPATAARYAALRARVLA